MQSRRIHKLALITISLFTPALAFAEDMGLADRIIRGQLEEVAAALDAEDDVDRLVHAPFGKATPLKIAIYDREEDIALYLLSRGADFHASEVTLATVTGEGLGRLAIAILERHPEYLGDGAAINSAVISGYYDVVERLIEHRVEGKFAWDSGDPVASALMVRHDDIARLLVESGARVGANEMALAARESSPGIVQLLLSSGASPQWSVSSDTPTEARVPLDFAWARFTDSKRSDLDISRASFVLNVLRSRGARSQGYYIDPMELDASARDGLSELNAIPSAVQRLNFASTYGFFDLVDELLKRHSFHPTELADAGKNALLARNDDIARKLIESGAALDTGILNFAIRYSSPGMVRKLLAMGADPDAEIYGETPLETWWQSAQSGNWDFRVLHEMLASTADGCWLTEFADEMPVHVLDRLKNTAWQCWITAHEAQGEQR